MILTDKELRDLREVLDVQSGLNAELLQHCGMLIHLGKFDEAVRTAFILLEERLRRMVGQEGMTGTNLANYAFNVDTGPLAKHLASNKSEREGLRELYSGAFKLFRNPSAHGVVGYSQAEGKAIIGLVNLLLLFLDRADELPPPQSLPPHVEKVLVMIEKEIGVDVAGRLRVFLGKTQKLGLKSPAATNWLPFRCYALQTRSNWSEPRAHHLPIFYLVADEKNPYLWFPINQYYTSVVGIDTEPYVRILRKLGFTLYGQNRDYRLNLRDKNSTEFFEALFELVTQIERELEATL